MLVAVLTGLLGRSGGAPIQPPTVLVAAATPTPSASGVANASATSPSAPAAILGQPPAQAQSLTRLESPLQVHVTARWMEGFYPIYAIAQRTFGVNWLLIASIHEQESAFSTAPEHLPRPELRATAAAARCSSTSPTGRRQLIDVGARQQLLPLRQAPGGV